MLLALIKGRNVIDRGEIREGRGGGGEREGGCLTTVIRLPCVAISEDKTGTHSSSLHTWTTFHTVLDQYLLGAFFSKSDGILMPSCEQSRPFLHNMTWEKVLFILMMCWFQQVLQRKWHVYFIFQCLPSPPKLAFSDLTPLLLWSFLVLLSNKLQGRTKTLLTKFC